MPKEICIYCGKEIKGKGKQVMPGKVPGAVKLLDSKGKDTGKWKATGNNPISCAHNDCPK